MTYSLLFEAKEMALESRRKFLTLKYALKVSSTPNNRSYSNIFFDRYKAFYTNKRKIPSPFHIRLNKVLQSTTFKIHPTIERKPPQIPPWAIKTFPTNTSFAELPKKILSSTDHRTRFLELNNNYAQHARATLMGQKRTLELDTSLSQKKPKKHKISPFIIYLHSRNLCHPGSH